MDSNRCFRWIGGRQFYIPSRMFSPGDRVCLCKPNTFKPEYRAVVKAVDMTRLLLSVQCGRWSVLKIVHWSRVVLEDDAPVQRELFDVIGGAA